MFHCVIVGESQADRAEVIKDLLDRGFNPFVKNGEGLYFTELVEIGSELETSLLEIVPSYSYIKLWIAIERRDLNEINRMATLQATVLPIPKHMGMTFCSIIDDKEIIDLLEGVDGYMELRVCAAIIKGENELLKHLLALSADPTREIS